MKQVNVAAIVIGAVTTVIGIGIVVAALGAYRQDLAIELGGATAPGIVLDKTIVYATDGSSDFDVRYRFTPPGAPTRETSGIVARERWEAMSIGDTIEIRFDPDDPARNFPAGEGVTALAPVAIAVLIGLALAVFGLALLWGGLHPTEEAE